MRIAFTIVLNGLHHIKHNDYYKRILNFFDYWVVVEGASNNTGSTSWCKEFPKDFHNNGKSVDGTNEFLSSIKKEYPNLIHIEPNGPWDNKDVQINKAIETIREITKECILWEIDIDEQWTEDQWRLSEELLLKNNAKTGCFLCNYYVGKDILAIGDWGEGKIVPYRRLWDWKGEYFETHEPPNLKGGNGLGILITNVKFNHYAYYFEQDVLFKNKWYSGHEEIYENWKKLQNETTFPKHISYLLGTNTHWGCSNTQIIKERK
jgi:hypothetical protein